MVDFEDGSDASWRNQDARNRKFHTCKNAQKSASNVGVYIGTFSWEQVLAPCQNMTFEVRLSQLP